MLGARAGKQPVTRSIRAIAKKDLIATYKLSEDEASRVVESMVQRLKGGSAALLGVPLSPEESSFPIMYVPEVRGFVKVYEW